jgi:hypothetical protein
MLISMSTSTAKNTVELNFVDVAIDEVFDASPIDEEGYKVKAPSAKNIGNADVYVRMVLAGPGLDKFSFYHLVAEADSDSVEYDNKFYKAGFNVGEDPEQWTAHADNPFTFYYNSPLLAQGENDEYYSTSNLFDLVKLNDEDYAGNGEDLDIAVYIEAIQTGGFNSAAEAFSALKPANAP